MAGTLCLLVWPICFAIAHAAVPDAAVVHVDVVEDGPGATLELPAGTPLVVALDEAVASSTHKRGDMFKLRLAEPLVVDGMEVIPAGTPGTGQVVHAAAARGGGAAGELLLAARTLDWNGRTVALRAFSVSATGVQQTGAAIGVAVVAGPFAMFVRGREIEIPAGTRGNAKLAAVLALAQTDVPAIVGARVQPGADAGVTGVAAPAPADSRLSGTVPAAGPDASRRAQPAASTAAADADADAESIPESVSNLE